MFVSGPSCVVRRHPSIFVPHAKGPVWTHSKAMCVSGCSCVMRGHLSPVILRIEHIGRTRCKRTRTPDPCSELCGLRVVVGPWNVAHGVHVHGAQVVIPVNGFMGSFAQVKTSQKGARREARSECGRESRGPPGHSPYVWRELRGCEYGCSRSNGGRVAYVPGQHAGPWLGRKFSF